jgi:hypothetical protein
VRRPGFSGVNLPQALLLIVLLLLLAGVLQWIGELQTAVGFTVLSVATVLGGIFLTPFLKTTFQGTDGRPAWRKILGVLAVVLVGFLIANAPGWLVHLSTIKRLYPPDEQGLYENVLIYQSISGVLLYLSIVVFALWWKSEGPKSGVGKDASPNETYERRERFIRALGLVAGGFGGDTAHKQEYMAKVQEETAKLIQKDRLVRVLAVNAAADLVPEDSPIRMAIESERPRLKILLLDPFSTFARERANYLRQDDDFHTSWLRYVWDFLRTTETLNTIRQSGIHVEHRVYCSRPLFRIYLSENEATGECECISQAYLSHRHGYETPYHQYQYTPNEHDERDNVITLNRQAFQYIWDRGFSSFTASGLTSIPIVYYMANMQGLPLLNPDQSPRNFETLRAELLQRIDSSFEQARQKFA